MQKRKNRASRREWGRYRRRIKWAAVIAGLLALLFWFDHQLRPVITTMAAYQCKVVSVLAINRAVQQELEDSPELYQQLYDIKYGPEGRITSIQASAAAVNQAKVNLTSAVLEELEKLEKQVLSIPLGTLLGWQLLAGYGPDISLKAVPSGFVTSEFHTTVQTEGVNQTLLSGYITFHVEMSALLPGYYATEEVEDEVCVVQTLVVGEVPQVYAALREAPRL